MPGGPTECNASTPFGYTGQYQDQESGLVYLRARYYDPATELFISRDPLEQKTGQPYVYAYGNPVNFVDPAGLEGESLEQQMPPAKIAAKIAGGMEQLRQAISSGRIRPILYELRGQVYNFRSQELRDKHPNGVRFTEDGFPDFSPYAEAEVKIKMKGNTHSDFRAANKAIGRSGRMAPNGFTWHHHEDRTTMQLVPSYLHDDPRHTGGEAIIRHLGRLWEDNP